MLAVKDRVDGITGDAAAVVPSRYLDEAAVSPATCPATENQSRPCTCTHIYHRQCCRRITQSVSDHRAKRRCRQGAFDIQARPPGDPCIYRTLHVSLDLCFQRDMIILSAGVSLFLLRPVHVYGVSMIRAESSAQAHAILWNQMHTEWQQKRTSGWTRNS